jgi:hypothetical protein
VGIWVTVSPTVTTFRVPTFVYLQVWDCSFTTKAFLYCVTDYVWNISIFFGASVPLMLVEALLSKESSVTILAYYGVLFRVLTSTIGFKTRQTLSGTLMRVPMGIRLLTGVAVVGLA